MTPRRSFLAALVLTLPLVACGDDDETAEAPETTTTASDTTEEPAALPEDACALVPDAAEVSGLELSEPAPDGDERRRVCAFSAVEDGQVGLTVAVQGGSRFDEKAEQSEASLGDPGEEIDGLGDRALFFFSDEDIPEGVGGLLVELGDVTLEVTLQDLEEAAMRDAAVAIGTAAVERL
jgi:hypothetical protein